MHKFREKSQNHPAWIIGLPALLALSACQTTPRDSTLLKIEPTARVTHSIDTATAAYAVGRYYQGQIRYEQAIAAYRKSLALNPENANARNGLGLVFAAQGRYKAAIAEFEQAVTLAPDVARFRNNLGYALLQHGDARRAAETLQAAQGIDPGNLRIRENLQTALAQEAQRKLADAGALTARMQESPPVAAAVNGEGPLTPTLASPPHPASVAAAASGQHAVTAQQPSPAGFRLEIANGNGVTGLAKRMSSMFGDAGYTTARRTNCKPYIIERSEIQYRPGHETAAVALIRHLPHPVPLVPSTQLRADIQVRLLLGQDVRQASKAVGAVGSADTALSPDDAQPAG